MTTPTTQCEADERALWEAAKRKQTYAISGVYIEAFSKNPDGTFRTEHYEYQFMGWQLARAAIDQSLPLAPLDVLTNEQIAAGAEVLCDCPEPKRIGRNAAISVAQAMAEAATAQPEMDAREPMDPDAAYKMADALYAAGYKDRHNERDYDPRKCPEWQAVVDPLIEQAAPLAPSLDRDTIRAVFMRHGFTVKDGQTDLKPYVYAAAQELIALAQQVALEASALPAAMRALRDLLLDVQAGVLDGDAARDAQVLLDNYDEPEVPASPVAHCECDGMQEKAARTAEDADIKKMMCHGVAHGDDGHQTRIAIAAAIRALEGCGSSTQQAAPEAPASEQQAEKVSCPECSGTGSVMMEGDCSDCNGKGYDWEPMATTASASDMCPACAEDGGACSNPDECNAILSAFARAPLPASNEQDNP